MRESLAAFDRGRRSVIPGRTIRWFIRATRPSPARPAAPGHRANVPAQVTAQPPSCGGALGGSPQPHVGVVLERLADRALDLAQGALRGTRRRGERAAQRLDHELVRLGGELEAAPLAGGADDAACRPGEPDEPVRLTAASAGRELRGRSRPPSAA